MGERPAGTAAMGAVRWLLLALALAACLVAYAPLLGVGDGPPAGVVHHCPMHPQVVGQSTSSCPICSMALEPLSAERSTTEPAAGPLSPARAPIASAIAGLMALDLDLERRRRGGLGTRRVRRRPLVSTVSVPAVVAAGAQVSAPVAIDLASALKPGAALEFRSSVGSGPSVPAVLASVPPQGSQPRWTLVVQAELAQQGASAPTGTSGVLDLGTISSDVLVVPHDAVLHGPETSYVFVLAPDGRFTPRSVLTGRRQGGEVVVLRGLVEGEEVLAPGAFYCDAESRLASGFAAAADRAGEGGATR